MALTSRAQHWAAPERRTMSVGCCMHPTLSCQHAILDSTASSKQLLAPALSRCCGAVASRSFAPPYLPARWSQHLPLRPEAHLFVMLHAVLWPATAAAPLLSCCVCPLARCLTPVGSSSRMYPDRKPPLRAALGDLARWFSRHPCHVALLVQQQGLHSSLMHGDARRMAAIAAALPSRVMNRNL